MASTSGDVYYDPYDPDIYADPFPVFGRLREESPLYYNERHGFYALSRFEDVERGLVDHQSYLSGRGAVLDMIKANLELPPGTLNFEDPPVHTARRGLLNRVFTPKKMNTLEPDVRELCAECLDPLIGSSGFDFIADLGAKVPIRIIGKLLGIPEQDQEFAATSSARTCGPSPVSLWNTRAGSSTVSFTPITSSGGRIIHPMTS